MSCAVEDCAMAFLWEWTSDKDHYTQLQLWLKAFTGLEKQNAVFLCAWILTADRHDSISQKMKDERNDKIQCMILLLRIVKVLDSALITIPFALCWYLYYAERVYSPFYSKGNILVVALFFVAYITFGRIYDAFRMSMQRVSEVIYAQFLAAGASDLLMYVVIWLLTKHLPNIFPGVAALVGQILLAVVGHSERINGIFQHSHRRRQPLSTMSVTEWKSWSASTAWITNTKWL